MNGHGKRGKDLQRKRKEETERRKDTNEGSRWRTGRPREYKIRRVAERKESAVTEKGTLGPDGT